MSNVKVEKFSQLNIKYIDEVLAENFIVYVEESRCTVQGINVQWDFVFYRDIRFSTSTYLIS